MKARFEQSRNDLYWDIYDLDDGFVRWTGYNDDYWWNNISVTEGFKKRTGKVTGRIYELNIETGDVTIKEKE